MIIRGRSISPGIAKGKVVKLDDAFSFLGGVDATTGDLKVADSNIAGKVFVFPKGKGSTVGSFVMYDLMVHGKAPAAVVNREAETIVTTGAVISSIPMVDRIDTDILSDGDTVTVNGTDGTISVENVRFVRTVSSMITVGGKILVLHRPDNARSFPGRHSLVSGKMEGDETPIETARREVMEETGISLGEPDASLEPQYIREGGVLWEVTAFRFDLAHAEPVLNHENSAFEWLTPEELCSDPKAVTKVCETVRRLVKMKPLAQ